MYLIRHDRVDKVGICYGATDVEPLTPFERSAQILKAQLPTTVNQVVTSPLSRCSKLAQQLFVDQPLIVDHRIQEVDFGAWENKPWQQIPKQSIDLWAKTPTHFQFPEGEHLSEFYSRVKAFWRDHQTHDPTACVVTHAGVIRLLVSLQQQRPWQDCLSIPVPYLGLFYLTDDKFECLTQHNTGN